MTVLIAGAEILLLASAGLLFVYALRHYLLAIWRLFLGTRHDSMELVGQVVPRITVLVPMHNEQRVAKDVLEALVACDYDWARLQILAIDDRSTDRTGEIIDAFCREFDFIQAVHISSGPGGKAAALQAATQYATGEVLLLFDADYVPSRSILEMLAAPFADPQVGAVMGRVVPHNSGNSLLAGLLGLERAAGYQASQQSRSDLLGIAQFGGTAGGVRLSALTAAGGWRTDSLTEDTDLTCRLLIHGWRIAYVNRAECYEEVPESWEVRGRQLTRWVTGHTECLHRYWRAVLRSPYLGAWQKIDLVLLLACYWTAPAILIGWAATLLLFFTMRTALLESMPAAMLLLGFQLFANQATFLELGVAALLDGSRDRILLLPLNMLNFFASTGTICRALLVFYWRRLTGDGADPWDATPRFRSGHTSFLGGNRSEEGLLRRSRSGVYLAAQPVEALEMERTDA